MAQQIYLITGAAGFLGWNIARVLMRGTATIVGTWHRHKPDRCAAGHCMEYDLESGDAELLLAAASPDVLVHCAALSSRAECATDPARARSVNVEASRRLAEACSDRGTIMVYISTDLVFDGSAAPYTEDDPVSPASTYAETKAEAEKAVAEACPQHYILRAALMYGITADDTPGSFLSWNAGNPGKGEAVQLYTDQFRMPLYAPDMATVIEGLVFRHAPYGVYHCAGPERLSRHQIGMGIASNFGLNAALMEKTKLGRIDDTSLRTEKLVAATGMRFTSFETGLGEVAQRIVF